MSNGKINLKGIEVKPLWKGGGEGWVAEHVEPKRPRRLQRVEL